MSKAIKLKYFPTIYAMKTLKNKKIGIRGNINGNLCKKNLIFHTGNEIL